jgi:hypothetical protein
MMTHDYTVGAKKPKVSLGRAASDIDAAGKAHSAAISSDI